MRPRADRERVPDDVSADDGELDIDALVLAALDAGAVSLSEVTAHVLTTLPEARRFAAAGRVAARVAGRVRVRSERERPWVAVSGALEVEQWSLARREA
jgi:hypothetical protein